MNTMSATLVEKKQGLIMIDIADLNEKLIRYNNVVSINLNFDYIYEHYNCEIVLSEDIFNENNSKLCIEFNNISQFNLIDFNSKFNQFVGAFVERETNGLEGVRYFLSQYENEDVSLKCFDISYTLN